MSAIGKSSITQYLAGLLSKRVQMRKIICILIILLPVLLPAQKKQDEGHFDSLARVLASDDFKDREDTVVAGMLIDLTYYYYDANPEKGIEYGKKGLELSQKLDWKKGSAKLNTYLGANYYTKSDYPKALEYWLKALSLNEALGNKKDYALNLLNVGRIYLGQKNYTKTLDFYLKALKISEELKDKINVPLILGEIGSAYLAQNNFPKALEYYSKALSIYKDHNDKSGISQNTGNIGTAYMLSGDYPKALEYYFKAYPMDKELGDKSSMSIELGNIGEAYLNIYQDTSVKFSLTPVNLPGIDILEGNEATIPKDKNLLLRKAIAYLNSSVALSTEIGFLNALQEYSKVLSDAQALLGNYKEALETYKKFSIIRDSVFSTENNAKISNLEWRRETELKEEQIAVQQLQIIADKKEMRYFLVIIILFSLFSLGLYGRFRIVRNNKRLLEEKNKLIAAEKENADMMRMRAENSEKFKQQFLANMSHEIRTPMNAVNGMTDILINKKPRPDQLPYLNVISRSSDILLHIINDILDLSKIEAGKLELENIDFSLSETLQQVKETLSFKAEEKGLSLVTHVDTRIGDILVGDPYRLNQVLINLGGNAIKFTSRGGVEIKVDLVGQENHQLQIKFSVIDTGMGIASDKLNSLFENFRQLNSSDARKFGGTGLGLSISKQLVELQGGKIDVESVEGQGATFSFIINYTRGQESRFREQNVIDHNTDGTELNGLRILLADDNEYNRLVVTETLRLKADLIIDEALNGRQAVVMMAKGNYDVVLMDVQMPEMNGFEASKYIREKLPAPQNKTPIIALTASLLRADIDLCYQNGMNTYIPKPFKTWQLFKTIAEQTGRKGKLVLKPIYIPPVAEPVVKPAAVNEVKVPEKIEPVQPETPAVQSNAVWTDMAYLTKFCEGDEKRMRKYISVFRNSVPTLDEKLKNAITEKDYTEIALQVHGFKPKWMMMGMKQTSELGQKIDYMCKNAGSIENISESVLSLLQQNEAAAKELETF